MRKQKQVTEARLELDGDLVKLLGTLSGIFNDGGIDDAMNR
jgi:hypothetical protein